MANKIIFEGGDHVGKTTAARMLEAGTGIPIIHAGLKGDDYDHIFDRMADLLTTPQIYDRFHLSAFVYGRLLHQHQQNLDDMSFRILVEWIRNECATTIIMFASDHDELERRMLADMAKDEAFNIDVRLMANVHYEILATDGYQGHPVCEIAWDISTQGFPQMHQVAAWMD